MECKKFLDNLRDAAYEIDMKGIVTYANSAAEHLTGVPLTNIIGYFFLHLVSEGDRKKVMNLFIKTLRCEETEGEITIPNGAVAHLKTQPLMNEKNEVVGAFGIARDITEKNKAAERKLQLDKVEAALMMARTCCHEMAQPMQAIIGGAEAMELCMKQDGFIESRHINDLIDQVIRLRTTLANLHDVVKLKKMAHHTMQNGKPIEMFDVNASL